MYFFFELLELLQLLKLKIIHKTQQVDKILVYGAYNFCIFGVLWLLVFTF